MSKWLSQEVDILKSQYKTCDDKKLLKMLPNKTKTAIYHKAHKLHISKDKASKYRLDNRIENLKLMTKSSHMAYHDSLRKGIKYGKRSGKYAQ